MSRAVPALLHQGLVELPASTRVDGSPAIFTVILQTGDVSAEERSELAPAARPLALIAQLVVQDVWLDFHLQPRTQEGGYAPQCLRRQLPHECGGVSAAV